MTVTEILDISKKQCKIMIDYEFAFVLYKGELRLYGISLNSEISDENYHRIIDEVLTKRCKLRAMNLLKERAYSEKKLREKLTRSQYPLVCIDTAMEYVKSFGYINDLRMAQDYLFYHGKNLNRRQIFAKLMQRGIPEAVIREAYQTYCNSDEMVSEEELIHKQLQKKLTCGLDAYSPDEKNKLIKKLLYKGFSFDAIIHAMRTFLPESNVCQQVPFSDLYTDIRT